MSISKVLLKWYDQNKRELPWRETKNPYIIWVSEIILQQTRVNQGISYFYRFIEKYPDVNSLASDSIDHVLSLWQGLGYYSRARNMHQTAKAIMTDYQGKFPKQYSELIKLKGIGEYTAAAIASFCYNEPVAVVDGNVYRFLARFYGLTEQIDSSKGKTVFKNMANKIINLKDPAKHNQAIMEFGALVCTPKNPECAHCIFKNECFAFTHNMINDLPVKKKKIKVSKRYFNYLHLLYNGKTFIEKRVENDIWQLLYQLPLIETETQVTSKELQNHKQWIELFDKTSFKITYVSQIIKHQLSHQQLIARFYQIEINKPNRFVKSKYILITHSEIYRYGIPKLIENYFKTTLH